MGVFLFAHLRSARRKTITHFRRDLQDELSALTKQTKRQKKQTGISPETPHALSRTYQPALKSFHPRDLPPSPRKARNPTSLFASPSPHPPPLAENQGDITTPNTTPPNPTHLHGQPYKNPATITPRVCGVAQTKRRVQRGFEPRTSHNESTRGRDTGREQNPKHESYH